MECEQVKFLKIVKAPCIECPITKKIRLVEDCKACAFYKGHSQREVRCCKQ
jgi:hypothetical protein